jgi:hypothetical protein
MRTCEIPWPDVAVLVWDGDEICDPTSGRRADLAGSPTPRRLIMTYRFDKCVGVRAQNVHWTAVFTNRGTKGVLMKNGSVHRELNRSFYCAEAYDYPITLGIDRAGRAVVFHCPNSFDRLEIEDAETGQNFDSLKSRDMEFHSRLDLSADGRLLIDAGWFWHPWCGAAVFEMTYADDGTFRFAKNTAFSAQNEIESVGFRGDTHLVVASASEHFGEEPASTGLRPKQLGLWSFGTRDWDLKLDVEEPMGLMMPWKDWVVSFFQSPKLIEIATGKITHRWDSIYSGKQRGPIELGDPPPPPLALDSLRGRFAVADSEKVTVVCL